jgi:hypothetical protein
MVLVMVRKTYIISGAIRVALVLTGIDIMKIIWLCLFKMSYLLIFKRHTRFYKRTKKQV